MSEKRWRGGSVRFLQNRPIYAKDWPKLIEAMIQDGLTAMIMSDGGTFYHGGYEIKRKSICNVWGLSRPQMRRLIEYVLVNDPFINSDSEN